MESGIDFLVEQGPFPCKIGKFGSGYRCERDANAIPISMISMRSNFCPNIWSTKLSRFMSSGRKLIGWSCARLSGTGKLGLSWYPH